MLIGRSRRCDVTIRSPLVSRRHCRLEPRDAGYFLRDLGSQNGTWIDGERIDHAFLQSGDRFVAGDVVLRVTNEGGVAEEGTSNPRRMPNPLRLREQGPALALVFLPLLGGVALLVTLGLGENAEERADSSVERASNIPSDGQRTSPEIGAIGTTPTPTEETPTSSTASPTPTTPTPGEQRPSSDVYTLEELLAIAEACDRELAVREAEMAALLADDHGVEVGVAGVAGETSDRSEPAIQPPSLEEAWSGIEGDAVASVALSGAPIAPATTNVAPTAWPAPEALEERKERRDSTEVVSVTEYAQPAGPLFPESARQDLALAIVEEGRGLIDRYHVRSVSYSPLRPLISRLRDLDGTPAVHGLLTLREHTHDQLGKVYRRVQKLEREAKNSARGLAKRPSGSAEEREDELTLRLAALVQEHLETLVLIRDDLEAALVFEERPMFLTEILRTAITQKELRLFELGAGSARESSCWETVPVLIEGVGSSAVKIRKGAREALEEITGEKPGSSRRSWMEWWDSREGKERAR